MARSRVVALDGLRALAALSVVFTHATGAIAKTPWQSLALYHGPLAVLLNATGAVHPFFVLSGYCLSESALRSLRPRELVQFYVRRVARIQPVRGRRRGGLAREHLALRAPGRGRVGLIFSCGAPLLVIGASQAPPLQRLLSARPLAFLGRVSYSIYLLHFTVVAAAARLLAEPVGLLGGVAFVLLVAAATCARAPLCYRGVELPCIRAGAALRGMLAAVRSSDGSPA